MFKIGEKVYSKTNKQEYEVLLVNKDTLVVTWEVFGEPYLTTVDKSCFIPNKNYVYYRKEKIEKIGNKFSWAICEGNLEFIKTAIDITLKKEKQEKLKIGYECKIYLFKKSNKNLRKKIKELKIEIEKLKIEIFDLNENIDNMEWE